MRIWILILLVVSVGFTRAAFAMPAMSADMSMPDMSMMMGADQEMHHHHDAMRGSKPSEPTTKAAQSHCLCVMCFPAIAAAMVPEGDIILGKMPIPANGFDALASRAKAGVSAAAIGLRSGVLTFFDPVGEALREH